MFIEKKKNKGSEVSTRMITNLLITDLKMRVQETPTIYLLKWHNNPRQQIEAIALGSSRNADTPCWYTQQNMWSGKNAFYLIFKNVFPLFYLHAICTSFFFFVLCLFLSSHRLPRSCLSTVSLPSLSVSLWHHWWILVAGNPYKPYELIICMAYELSIRIVYTNF